MRQSIYVDNEVCRIFFGSRLLDNCKACYERSVEKLCDLILTQRRCCLGDKPDCDKSKDCPNNHK